MEVFRWTKACLSNIQHLLPRSPVVFRRNGETDQKPLGPLDRPHRCSLSNRQRCGGLHLAQDLLGLHYKKSQRRCKTYPDTPNPQPHNGPTWHRMGMAVEPPRWNPTTPQHRSATHHVPSERSPRCPSLPGDESCHLLSDRYCGLLLGVH